MRIQKFAITPAIFDTYRGMHNYNRVSVVKLSVNVKLFVLLLCVCVCNFACKGCPQNDLYCVGWDIEPYSLTPRITLVHVVVVVVVVVVFRLSSPGLPATVLCVVFVQLTIKLD